VQLDLALLVLHREKVASSSRSDGPAAAFAA
jgi:hypothetical protein